MKINSLNNLAVNSVKWTIFADVLSSLIQPLTFLILARLLAPEDFGVVGIALLIISFAKIFGEAGLGKALIQRQDEKPEVSNAVFLNNLFLGIVAYIFILFFARWFSLIFQEPKIANILRILGLEILLYALGVTHYSLLLKKFDFKKNFLVISISAFTHLIISVFLAFKGFGIWALVLGYLFSSAIRLLLLWILCPWRPNYKYNLALSLELFSFGIFIMIEYFQLWFLSWGDNAIVGYFLGMKDLGIYAMGYSVVILILGIFPRAVLPIAFSYFSKLQSDSMKLKESFIRITKTLACIILPLSVIIFLSITPLSRIFLSDKWRGIDTVIRILAIMPGLGYILDMHPVLYKALGRADIMPKFHVASLIYCIPVFLLAAPHGLLTFCLARFSVGFVFAPLYIVITAKLLKLPYNYLWKCTKSPLIATIIMFLLISPLIYACEDFSTTLSIMKLIMILLFGIVVYIGALKRIDGELFHSSIGLVKKIIYLRYDR